MASLYRGGRVWYIDVRHKDRRIRKAVGSSKKIAELALKDAEVAIAKDKFGFAKNDIAIDAFLDRFLEYSRANHQPATTNRYRAVVDHFRAFLKTSPKTTFLSEINTEIIDRYKVHRKDSFASPNGQAVSSEADANGHTRKGARAHTINFEIGTLKSTEGRLHKNTHTLQSAPCLAKWSGSDALDRSVRDCSCLKKRGSLGTGLPMRCQTSRSVLCLHRKLFAVALPGRSIDL